jgi:aspartyl protease family protein
MVKNALVFAAGALAVALLAPTLLPLLTAATSSPPSAAASLASASVAAPAAPAVAAPVSDGFRQTSIAADGGGQFSTDVLIEGERVHMLVDTGATMVSISAAVAARLGIRPDPSKPKWRIHTANGDSIAWPATLRNVSFGALYMNDVEALVLDRSAGEVNLLGASFLKRLAGVEQRDGLLILRQ